MPQTPQISQMAVATAEELIAATQNEKVSEINISADLADLSPLRLMPGQTLRSVSDRHAVLSFRSEADGLEVTTDNSVFDLDVRVTPTHRAIWNDRAVDSLGIGTLVVRRGIETFGGTGPSLVKGVVQNLSATALSVKPGGSAHLISVDGNIETHGREVLPIEIFGSIGSLNIRGVSFHGS